MTDVTQNADDQSLAPSKAWQPRGIAPQGAALNLSYRLF